jgi:hypothetical protein
MGGHCDGVGAARHHGAEDDDPTSCASANHAHIRNWCTLASASHGPRPPGVGCGWWRPGLDPTPVGITANGVCTGSPCRVSATIGCRRLSLHLTRFPAGSGN